MLQNRNNRSSGGDNGGSGGGDIQKKKKKSMLNWFLDSVGKYMLHGNEINEINNTNEKDQKEQQEQQDQKEQDGDEEEQDDDEEEQDVAVVSETIVLLRTLANSKKWIDSMKLTFNTIVKYTLSESKKDFMFDSNVLSRCAAVFSVVGGYKDTLRIGGYATWSDEYKARRSSRGVDPVDVDEKGDVTPLLLILSMGNTTNKTKKTKKTKKEKENKENENNEKKENDNQLNMDDDDNVVRVKIVKRSPFDDTKNPHENDIDTIITVRRSELRAVSEVLEFPNRLLFDFSTSSFLDSELSSSSLSPTLELLNVLLSKTQPVHFTRNSMTEWQELKTIALKASTELLRDKKTCEACSRHPTFLRNLLDVATHSASEVATITEAAEGVETLELQSRNILRLQRERRNN